MKYRILFKTINFTFITALIAVISFAGEARGSSYSFTNQDLSKYKGTSSTGSDSASESTQYSSGTNRGNNNSGAYTQNRKKHVVPYSGSARRIIIPVTFDRGITVPMLLDTGAPGMHISTKLAEKIGIIDNDSAKLQILVGGIGGTAPGILTIIDTIRIGEAESSFIPTHISDINFGSFEGLIGMDFMTSYEVRIDSLKRVVIFEERPESSNMPGGHDRSWWKSTFHDFRSKKEAWDRFRTQINRRGTSSDRERRIKQWVEDQYRNAEELYNKLLVHAGENSVPLEWR